MSKSLSLATKLTLRTVKEFRQSLLTIRLLRKSKEQGINTLKSPAKLALRSMSFGISLTMS